MADQKTVGKKTAHTITFMEFSAAALALANYLKEAVKARDERQSAEVLREHLKLIERATGPVLDENKQLHHRIRELEDANRILERELRSKSKAVDEGDDNAYRVLRLVYDRASQKGSGEPKGFGRVLLVFYPFSQIRTPPPSAPTASSASFVKFCA